MKVRDELMGGPEFERSDVRWATPQVLPRTEPVGWGRIGVHADMKRTHSGQKAWVLHADGGEWWPVEVVGE